MFGSFGAGFGTFGGGVGGVLPAFTNLTSWLKAPTQDGTTLVNSKGVDAELTDVNCLNLDGIDDEVNTNYNPQGGNLIIEATIKPDSVTNQRTIFGVNGNSGFWFRISNGDWQLYSRNGYIFTVGTGIDPTVGNIYDIRVEYDYSTEDWIAKVKLSTDSTYTTVGSGNRLPPIIEGANAILGQKGSSGYFDGEYYSFKLTEGGNVKVHYPFAEGSGTKAYDISGNGNHGTITGATWTTLDGIESWNHEYGFASAFANLDGADNKYLKFPLTGLDQSTFDMTMWLEGTNRSASAGKWFFNNGSQFNARGIEVKGATSFKMDFITYYSGGRVKLETPNQIVDGQMYKFDVHFESGNSYLVVDGVKGAVDTTTFTPAFTGTEDFAYIFARNNGLSAGRGIIYKLNINGEEKVLTDAELIGSPTRYNIPALNTKTKQVATFDGVADRLDFTAHTTAVGDVFDFKFDLLSNPDGAEGNHRCLLSNSVTRYIAVLDNDDGRIVVRGDSTQSTTGTIKVADGMSTLRVTIDSDSQVSVSINGGAAETLATDFTGIGIDRLMAGATGNVRFVNANVASFSITNSSGNKVVEYDFQNDIGTTTVQDLSTNNNDGTVTTGSGGTASFWGQRVADNDGVLVSADYATGNTSISNPAGFVHNNSECGLDMVTNDKTAAQLFAIDNSTATQTFVKKDSEGNITQVLDYSAALTGNDLTRTRNYVG